jgi:hypothetical protein
MPAAEKVIFAEDASTIHISLGPPEKMGDSEYEPREGRVLAPGETVTLSEVTGDLRELVLKGEAPGLVLLTVNQAKKLNDQANRIKGAASLLEEENAENETSDE